MTRLLPFVLSTIDLPESELCAARLDGQLFAVGDGYGVVDQMTGADQRAGSLVARVSSRLIAERATAAWIFGALDASPPELQFCVESSARYRAVGRSPGVVREVVIDPEEIVNLGGMRVTSLQRTVVDLVRTTEEFGEVHGEIVRRLASIGAFTLADCVALVESRRNLPGKRRAIERFAAVTSGRDVG